MNSASPTNTSRFCPDGAMRTAVFGMGTLAVMLCAAALGLGAWGAGQSPAAAAVLGLALALSSTAIVNAFDPGLLWVPAVEIWLEQQVLVRAGGFVPVAAGVDVDRFRGLTPQDLLEGSDAFPSLTTGFGARSEYGLQPFGAFVQLGAYLP